MNAPLASCIIVSTEISEPLTKISQKEKNEIKKKKKRKEKKSRDSVRIREKETRN